MEANYLLLQCRLDPVSLVFKGLFIYLAAWGPSCGVWDLISDQGLNPGSPALGVWMDLVSNEKNKTEETICTLGA